MSYLFNDMNPGKTDYPHHGDWLRFLKNNTALSVVSALAIVLHIYSLFFPISLAYDEPTHLMAGLGLYVNVNAYWNKLFSFPIQYFFPLFAVLLILAIRSKKISSSLSEFIKRLFAESKKDNYFKYVAIFSFLVLLLAYFYILRNLPYHPNIVRFPPLGKVLYLVSYLFTGINKVGPRIVQLLFYILCAVYLFKTIRLFRDSEASYLGASIFLFSPLVFFYAHRGELASGHLFSIVIISYYFLRFLKEQDDRDIILVSLFISIGFLYKRTALLMLFICIFYLIINKLFNRELTIGKYIKVLLLSVIPIIPWMIVAKFYVWRHYKIIWSHFISYEFMTSYLSMIPFQSSWLIYALFISSIFYGLYRKKDHLTFFFLLIFITYYLFFTADVMERIDRFSMALYPTIAVMISQLMSGMFSKKTLKYISPALIIYMALICTIWHVKPVNAKFISYRNIESRFFPVDKAMRWVKSNLSGDDKILILHAPPALFYRDKYDINKGSIIDYWYDLKDISNPDKLHSFIDKHKISYLMFSYGPSKDIYHNKELIDYLKADPDNKFMGIIKFNLDKNYIFIYKKQSI